LINKQTLHSTTYLSLVSSASINASPTEIIFYSALISCTFYANLASSVISSTGLLDSSFSNLSSSLISTGLLKDFLSSSGLFSLLVTFGGPSALVVKVWELLCFELFTGSIFSLIWFSVSYNFIWVNLAISSLLSYCTFSWLTNLILASKRPKTGLWSLRLTSALPYCNYRMKGLLGSLKDQRMRSHQAGCLLLS
jgi:hypothetical protein